MNPQDLPIPFKQMRKIIFEDQKDKSASQMTTLSAFNGLSNMLGGRLTLGEQQDSHEFISWLFGLVDFKPLEKYFQILSSQTTKCLTKSCTYENTVEKEAVQIFIQPNENIQECVKTCTRFKEEIEYKCDHCEGNLGLVSTHVIKPPTVIMLFTKLFEGLTNSKTTYDKDYKAFENFVNLPINFGDNNVRYKLKSFITHSGRQRHSGHYKAYVRQHIGWISCNDITVTSISEPKLSKDEHVYVQFYERIA